MGKRIDQLDGIRALAIAAVFLYHSLKIRLMWMGVDLFFILSGFLITSILIEHKNQGLRGYFGRFYKRRARRILPPYLLLLLAGLLLYGGWWLRHWYFYAFLMNFLRPLGVPIPSLFGPLWSLAVEEQFYLLWPLAVYFLSEKHLGRLTVGLIVAAPTLRWICTPWFSGEWAIYMLTPFRMDTLAAGALLAIVWRRYRTKLEQRGHYGLLASAAALAMLAALSRRGFSTHANTRVGNTWIYELSVIACTGAIVWALSGRGVRPLVLAPVRYLGRISYSFYLIHVAVILEVAKYVHGKAAVALLAAAVSLLYAACSWHFLEAPILAGGKKLPAPLPEVVAGGPQLG